MAIKISKNELYWNRSGIICGCICASLQLAVTVVCGNPMYILQRPDISIIMPPMWIYLLLSLTLSFLLGYGGGNIINCARCGKRYSRFERNIYIGGLFFISLIFLNLIRYQLFFKDGRIFTAFIVTLLCAASSAVSAYFWCRVSTLSAIITASFTMWMVYNVILTLTVLFRL